MPKPVGRTIEEVRVSQFVIENEQIIIGSMMKDPVLLRDLNIAIDINTFAGERHRIIFGVLQQIASKKLKFELELFYQLAGNKNYGGRDYVQKLFTAIDKVPDNINWHIDRLNVDAIKRELRFGVLSRLVDASEDPNCNLDDLSGFVQEFNSKISGYLSNEILGGDKLYRTYINDIKARRSNSVFTPTGFWELDKDLSEGLARKKVSIWTARPGVGKSTLLSNIADRTSHKYDVKTIYFPLEMATVPVLDGMISNRTNIKLDRLIKNPQELTKKELQLINQETYKITQDENLTFWEGGITKEKLSRVLNEGQYQLAVFDLYEKMVGSLEQAVIAQHLNHMQQIAKDCDCHFAFVHQTRRGVEKREDKRPTREDLKNSGGYEEVADLIVGLDRPKYWDDSIEEDTINIGILKQRRGTGYAWHSYKFDGAYCRIGEYVPGNFN